MADTKLVVCPQCGKKFKLAAAFDAASFQCKACGATIWTAGKPPAPETRKKGTGRSRGGARGRGRPGKAAAAAAPVGKRGGRTRREAAPEQEGDDEGGRRGRYERPKSNTNMVIAIVGLVAIVGGILFFVLNKKDPIPAGPGITTAQQPVAGTGGMDLNPVAAPTGSGTGVGIGIPTPSGSNPAAEKPAAPATDGGEGESPPDKPAKTLGGNKSGAGEFSTRYDPPADLTHLPDTSEDMKKKIDEWIGLMMDPDAGRDSLDAKEKLVAVGKPAFLPVLGAMAKVRDTITDVNSHEEKLLESSLSLADKVLREMDGYLNANFKSELRPGSEKRYIAYVCRLHYKRWMSVLKDMPEMPGAFDPSKVYEKESEEYR